jgi:hypothetical protein
MCIGHQLCDVWLPALQKFEQAQPHDYPQLSKSPVRSYTYRGQACRLLHQPSLHTGPLTCGQSICDQGHKRSSMPLRTSAEACVPACVLTNPTSVAAVPWRLVNLANPITPGGKQPPS